MLGGVGGAMVRVLVGVAAVVIGIILGKMLIIVVGVALIAIFGVRAMAAGNGRGRGKNLR